jgi:hypothetical protein
VHFSSTLLVAFRVEQHHLHLMTLQKQKVSLELRMKKGQDASVTLPKLGNFLKIVSDNLANADYTTKRLALDALSVKVLMDTDSVVISGLLPVLEGAITHSHPPLPGTTHPQGAGSL